MNIFLAAAKQVQRTILLTSEHDPGVACHLRALLVRTRVNLPTANGKLEFDIIQGLKRRDPAALADLYDRYGQMVYSAVFRILGNGRRDAEGVVQEIFLQAWTRAQMIDESQGTLAPWLLTLARNLAADHLRVVRNGAADRNAYTFVPTAVESSRYIDRLRAALENLVFMETTGFAGKFSRAALVTSLIAIVSIGGLLTCGLPQGISRLIGGSRSSALQLNASFQPDGGLRLSWRPDSHGQVRALLQIDDGSKRTSVTLDGTAWRSGSFDYQTQTNDVDVRLTASTGDQSVVAESVRVMSAPPLSAISQAARAIPASEPVHYVEDLPEFVLSAKPVQKLSPPPVVAAWYPPPVEESAPTVRGEMIASTGARLAIPTFPND